MLPKENRLNLKKSFSWVASGKKAHNNYLKLFFRIGQNNHPLVGIAISKSEIKDAVDRNRAKRLIASSFQMVYDKLPQNINIIAMPKSHVVGLSKESLDKHLAELLLQNQLLTG